MALTATIFLASFAILDSLAVPLSADSTTGLTSTSSSQVNSTWTTAGSPYLLVPASTTVSSTDFATSDCGSTSVSQSSTSASSTDTQASGTSPSSSSSPVSTTTVVSTVYESAPATTVTGPTQTVTDTITIVPPPTPAPTVEETIWSAPPQMTDLAAFAIQNFAYGHQNMRIIVSAPTLNATIFSSDAVGNTTFTPEAVSAAELALASATSAGVIPSPPEANASSFLQLFYPANSINPAQEPQGGADFYATPLDLGAAKNVTLEYSVFFPSDFDFVQAGKLPGIYGGHDGCSGGDDAVECFSTRLMWRANGAGELYLYAPKDKQTDALCSTPPLSVCDADWGLSVGRGAFAFTPGNWTHVKQTVTLNTPGKPDGGFALDVDGKRVIDRCDVYYRGVPQAADPEAESALPAGKDAGAPSPFAGDGEEDFIKGPFHLKVDSVLARIGVARSDEGVFTPAFAPPTPFALYDPTSGSGVFTPEFAPAGAPAAAAPDVKIADPSSAGNTDANAAAASTTTMTTTMLVTQTVTVYPTSTKTAYSMAMESDAPFAAVAVASPTPIGFTGLFFSTFFGGHEPKYATPKDQFTWFKDFAMTINA
ncbi:hypothetical protein BD413DRAFT_600822 [Trametes elegans]|nr:hypothetical protein BD413DRAFT_600822 [Trametes elegans]